MAEGEACDAPKKVVGACCDGADIAASNADKEETSTEAKKGPENEELPFYQTVVDIVDQMRPALAQDGGDVLLKRVTKDRVEVELSGSCIGCMMTDMTLSWIQQRLVEALGTYIQVVNVGTPVDHTHIEE